MTYAKTIKGKKMGRQVVSPAEDFHVQVNYWKGRHDKVRALLAAVADSFCYALFMHYTVPVNEIGPDHTGSVATCQDIMCAEVRNVTAAD